LRHSDSRARTPSEPRAALVLSESRTWDRDGGQRRMINARLRNVKYRALCLKNTAFGSARVKTRKCQYSGNMALRGPSSMLHASRARCTERANSDHATAKFGSSGALECNDSCRKVRSIHRKRRPWTARAALHREANKLEALLAARRARLIAFIRRRDIGDFPQVARWRDADGTQPRLSSSPLRQLSVPQQAQRMTYLASATLSALGSVL
jgi:hypothetical protein